MTIAKLTARLETPGEIKEALALVRGGRKVRATEEPEDNWFEKRTTHKPPRVLRLHVGENWEPTDKAVLEIYFGKSGSTQFAAEVLLALIHGAKGEERPLASDANTLSKMLPLLIKEARAAKTSDGLAKFVIVNFLVRPLVRRADEFVLHMNLGEEHQTETLTFPVFIWSLGPLGHVSTDRLCAWPNQHLLIYHDKSNAIGDGGSYHYIIEEALSVVDEHGWGELPHIDEVFRDMLAVFVRFSGGIPEDAQRIYDELRRKWEGLIAELPQPA